jgi:cytochrome c-type biogenesis protein CcmE
VTPVVVAKITPTAAALPPRIPALTRSALEVFHPSRYDPGVKRSPARLVIALSVAAALAVFILYTSIAGAGTPQISPSTLGQHVGEDVQLVGTVVNKPSGDAHAAGGLRFVLKDDHGANAARTNVLYTGSVPDLFRQGRQIVVEGTLRNGTFVAKPGSLITKCPSKYTPAKSNT